MFGRSKSAYSNHECALQLNETDMKIRISMIANVNSNIPFYNSTNVTLYSIAYVFRKFYSNPECALQLNETAMNIYISMIPNVNSNIPFNNSIILVIHAWNIWKYDFDNKSFSSFHHLINILCPWYKQNINV